MALFPCRCPFLQNTCLNIVYELDGSDIFFDIAVPKAIELTKGDHPVS